MKPDLDKLRAALDALPSVFVVYPAETATKVQAVLDAARELAGSKGPKPEAEPAPR